MASAALHGFALGFAIALTPGPMFFLCLRRTLERDWKAGLATGLGIASADGAYAAIAGGGVGALSMTLAGSQRWLALAGGLTLMLLGLSSLRGIREEPSRRAGRLLERGPYLSALALTLTNPATIVSFGAVFAAVGVRSPLTVAATAGGSLTWWVLLVAAAGRLRSRLGARAGALRLLSSLALVAFGVVAVGGALLR